MKKLGLLIIVLSFVGANIPGFAQAKAKTMPSIKEQTVVGGPEGKPCDCQKSGKPKKVSRDRDQAGTLAAGQDEKAKDATSTLGSGVGEQPVSKDKK